MTPEKKTTKPSAKTTKPKETAKSKASAKAKEVSKPKEVAEPKLAIEESVEESASKKKQDYLYAVGKRKTAIAQVRLYKKGEAGMEINGQDWKVVFPTKELQDKASASLEVAGQVDKLRITVKVSGGGKSAQSEAVRHGIARTLIQLNPNFRKPLKKAGFLTRDARKKERKKPGLKGARRAPQWQKR